MAEFPALPLWTDAYLGDTGHLTTTEHGAYLLLLITMWRTSACALPNDDKMLARYARCTAGQWARMKPVIMPFFRADSNQITQGRLTDERVAVKRNSTRQSDRVKARWLKTKGPADTAVIPDAYPEDTSLTLTLNTIGVEEDKGSSPTPARKRAEGVSGIAAEFEKVWPHYPRLVAKGNARKAWATARKKVLFEEIAGPLRLAIKAWRGTPVDKIPHFASWLNGECWLDNPEHAANRPRTSTEDLDRLSRISLQDELAALMPPTLRIVSQ